MRSACLDDDTTSFLGNSLALHRLNCVDRPSSFGDIDYQCRKFGEHAQVLLHGSSRFFASVPVPSRLRAVCPFHLPCADDSRLQ